MSGTPWSEDRLVWGEMREMIRALAIDELVVMETDRHQTCVSTAKRVAESAGFRIHTHRTENKVYILRTK